MTYTSHLMRQKFPLHQPSKHSAIRNQKIIFDKRKPRIDVSPIRYRACIVAINGDVNDCIINQAILWNVGIVERRSGKVAVVGFVGDDLILVGEVVDIAGCYVGEIGVPVRKLLANIRVLRTCEELVGRTICAGENWYCSWTWRMEEPAPRIRKWKCPLKKERERRPLMQL